MFVSYSHSLTLLTLALVLLIVCLRLFVCSRIGMNRMTWMMTYTVRLLLCKYSIAQSVGLLSLFRLLFRSLSTSYSTQNLRYRPTQGRSYAAAHNSTVTFVLPYSYRVSIYRDMIHRCTKIDLIFLCKVSSSQLSDIPRNLKAYCGQRIVPLSITKIYRPYPTFL
jgi:hypothetical protein